METAAGIKEHTIESEFARTARYLDIYLQQKTDLFLQHYVLDPADFLTRQVLYLSVIVPLLAAGIVVLAAGVILYISTFVPLWASLLITGAVISGMGAFFSYLLLSNKIVLKTPVASEAVQDGKT